MKKCKGDYRGFTHSSEAWYFNNIRTSKVNVEDEVFFGLCCGGGGSHGEMKMEWIELSGKIVPRLQVFDDGWEVLNSFSDLLVEMAKVDANINSWKEKSITPKEFCEMLLRCGFRDNTQRENPNPPPPTREKRLEDALLFIKEWFQRLEDGTEEGDPLKAMRQRVHAPIHKAIEEGLKQ